MNSNQNLWRAGQLARYRTIHPFPARMAPEIAFKAFKELTPESTVLDPMCGSGVVIRRALDCGHFPLGLDIDPLAVLMAKVWTSPISPAIQCDLGLELVRRAKELTNSQITLPWIDESQATVKYIDFWFHQAQKKQLRSLVAASMKLRGQRADLAKLALSRLIITKSRGASLAADVSHSRPHRVRQVNDFDIWVEFPKSFSRLLRIQHDKPPRSGGRIRHGDARKLHGIKAASIDAIVTSPPYINAIDYLRGHKLALVWLGHSLEDLQAVKCQGIGTLTGSKERLESFRIMEIIHTVSQRELPVSVERIVRKYVRDMLDCLKQTYRVLRPGGYAVYVVSNSVLQGIEVDTASIIIEAASDSGLLLENRYVRDIPKEYRYLPPPQTTTSHQLAARMRTETVLRFRKDWTIQRKC